MVVARLYRAFPDLHVTIEDLIEDGDKVVEKDIVTGPTRVNTTASGQPANPSRTTRFSSCGSSTAELLRSGGCWHLLADETARHDSCVAIVDTHREAGFLQSRSLGGLVRVNGVFREVGGSGTVFPDGEGSGALTGAAASAPRTPGATRTCGRPPSSAAPTIRTSPSPPRLSPPLVALAPAPARVPPA